MSSIHLSIFDVFNLSHFSYFFVVAIKTKKFLQSFNAQSGVEVIEYICITCGKNLSMFTNLPEIKQIPKSCRELQINRQEQTCLPWLARILTLWGGHGIEH